MARRMQVSTKRLMINQANTVIVAAVGVAAFVTAFSLVTARSLLAKQSYQRKVISAQEKALNQLNANVEAVNSLKEQYAAFVGEQENVIKGNSAGNGERDGDNARIVLDALPSKYDFPALASSLEKILVDRNYTIQKISGIDDEASQNGEQEEGGTDPTAAAGSQPPAGGASNDVLQQFQASQQSQTAASTAAVEMPFELSAKGSYGGMLDLLDVLRNSIRPMYVQQLAMTAEDDGGIILTITGKSYFQPAKNLEIKEEVVK